MTFRARRLRRDATFPERLLWSALKNQKIAGLKFRRQTAIGPWNVDFYCDSATLVVELDGLSHIGRFEEDRCRSEDLQSWGLRVIRFTNDEVLANLEAVIDAIARTAGAL